MMKKRICATLPVRDGIVVQSIAFEHYLPVGTPKIAIEFLSQWGIDEIILLDISVSQNDGHPDYAMVRDAAINCRVPLTVGGGITHVDHIMELMHSGADKVVLNQAALSQPKLISTAARNFGDQCIVVSIDGLRTDQGYRVYDYRKRRVIEQAPAALASCLESYGAGEILINSVDRDGSGRGFDLALIKSVCDAVTVPVIGCGGAGLAEHFIEIFQNSRVCAAAAGNFFHFSEHSVTTVKSLISPHVPVRHDTHFDYKKASFDVNGRLLKKDDRQLEDMLFLRIDKEVI